MEDKRITNHSELKESYNRLYKKGEGKLCVRTGNSFNDWVLNILQPGRGTSILDISCGQGFFLKSALEWTDLCFGGDISEIAVFKACWLVPKIRAIVTNSEMLSFRENSFEIITSLGSLEHYLNPEHALKEFSRCLKPGGRVFIFVPNEYYLGYFWNVLRRAKGPTHDQDFERFEALDFWKHMISREFDIEKIYKYNPGTGVSFFCAFCRSLGMAIQGKLWAGIKFTGVNVFFRLIPLNISKYFGFLCRLPRVKTGPPLVNSKPEVPKQ